MRNRRGAVNSIAQFVHDWARHRSWRFDMALTTLRRLRLIAPLAGAILALACGNTQAGSTYSDEGDLAMATSLQVTNAAYFSSSNQVEFLVAGDVPSGELTSVHLTFFDENGRPVQVDTNDDGKPDATALDLPGSNYTTGQAFFVQIRWNASLSERVHRVGAQVVDHDGNLSNTVYADLDNRPTLEIGDACDPRGFDLCPNDSTCKRVSGDWQAHCFADSSK